MTQQEAIDALEREWNEPQGFFFRLRSGKFEPSNGARIVDLIASINIGVDECVERRLVGLLWYLPLFTEWQKERVVEGGADGAAYAHFINALNNTLEDVLGVP